MSQQGMIHTYGTEPHIDARVVLWGRKMEQKLYSKEQDLARYYT
jgi:hypothetical protein